MVWRFIVISGLLFGLLPQPERAQARNGKIFITISVDWEGRDLDQRNLTAMSSFRQRFRTLPLLHFLNAAYFTRPYQDAAKAREKILSVMRPVDETGLHIHSWKSLVEASGVDYRHYPKWTPRIYHESQVLSCAYSDCGHEVPLWAYSSAEIRKIVRFSKDMLVRKGFDSPVSFRAGGWMADTKVLEVIASEGFRFDSSSVPTVLFGNQLNGYAIPGWAEQLWPGMSPASQPWPIFYGDQTLIEMPDNGCLSDYMTGEEMVKVFQKNRELWESRPDQDVYIHFGFHQETAQYYLERLIYALDRILNEAKSDNLPVYFTTFSDL